MKKIKIAQIGAGHDHAGGALYHLRKMDDIFDFVGYSIEAGDETNPLPKDKDFGTHDLRTTEELLNTPGLEAVVIETEDRRLTELALKAAERGLHIQMDKPGGISDADFEKLIRTVKKNQTVFHTGYMYRYNPAIIQLLEDVRSGKLGDIYSVEAHMSCEHPADKRQWLEAYPGGMLYFLGCHLIDVILSIQGVPENIIPLSTCIGQEGVTANDFGMAVFQYKNGVSFAKTTAMEVGGLERRQIVVCGTKGTVEIKPIEWYPEAGSSGLIARVHQVHRDEITDINWGRPADNHDTAPFERYESMIRGFASYVRGEAKNPYSYEHELLLHKVLLAACGVETDYKNFSL